MYEPKYLPTLDHTAPAIPGMRFGITQVARLIHPEDPQADPAHIHSYLEIFFNISSDVSFLVNNKLYPIVSGDVVISRPNEVHVCMFQKSAFHEYICLWIEGDDTSLPFSFLHQEDFFPVLSYDQDTAQALKDCLFSLVQLCQNEKETLEKTCCLLQFLVLLEKGKKRKKERIPIPDTLQTILDDIDENFSTIHSVNDLLKTHYVHSSTLTRWFRKYIHTSPREYLESKKLANAVKMLEIGSTVTDACISSGFSDCSHFIVLFKKKFGRTPLQYKRELF